MTISWVFPNDAGGGGGAAASSQGRQGLACARRQSTTDVGKGRMYDALFLNGVPLVAEGFADLHGGPPTNVKQIYS